MGSDNDEINDHRRTRRRNSAVAAAAAAPLPRKATPLPSDDSEQDSDGTLTRPRSQSESSASSSSLSSSSSSDDASHVPGAARRRQRRTASAKRAAQHRHHDNHHRHHHSRGPGGTSLWRKREQQFEKFRAATLVLPVPPTAVRVDKARGYSLHIMSVLSWVLPDAVLRAWRRPVARGNTRSSSGDSDYSNSDYDDDDDDDALLVTLGVHASLFHAGSKRFFGNTWVSPELAVDRAQIVQRHDASDRCVRYIVDRVALNVRAYFLSDVVDANCIGVLELVAYEKDRDSKATISVVGCGWTILPLFATSSSSASTTSVPRTPAASFASTASGESVSVFSGSPRVLWELPQSTWHAQPRQSQCKLYYELVLFPQLLVASALLRKHELVSALDTVAGLQHRNIANVDIGKRDPHLLKLEMLRDGDARDDDATFADALATFAKLASLVPRTIALASDHVTLVVRPTRVAIHLRDDVEANVVARLQISRTRLHAGATHIVGEVSARVLKLALHNGRSFCTRQHTVPLKVMESGSDFLQCVGPPAKLKRFVLDAYVAVVVLLQLTVHFRITWSAKRKQQAIDTKQPLPSEEDVVLVTLGTRAIVPSDGTKLFLYDKHDAATAASSASLMLIDSSTAAVVIGKQQQDKRSGLHVELLSGAPCRAYTDNPLYTPATSTSASSGRPLLEKQTLHESIASVDLQLSVDGVTSSVKPPPPVSPVREAAAAVSPAKSPLRIDTNNNNNEGDDHEDDGDDALVTPVDWAAQLLGKSHNESALAQALNALAAAAIQLAGGNAHPLNQRDVGASPARSPARSPVKSPVKHLPGSPTRADQQSSLLPPQTQTTQLTRASRTLLTRYGFVDAHDTSATSNNNNNEDDDDSDAHYTDAYRHRRRRFAVVPHAIKSLEIELRDVYKAHEVRFHFAAFRSFETLQKTPVPARVYFTFQFYSFAPTRTETLRLSKPFDNGSSGDSSNANVSHTHLLLREHPANNKPSLAIQFIVDTTAARDPLEPQYFATYLLHASLFVDVWDADSLFQIGTFAVPLHELMRQGSGTKTFQAEADVVAPLEIQCAAVEGDETDAVVDVTRGHSRTSNVVGAVQFLLSNYGVKGRHVLRRQAVRTTTAPTQQLPSASRVEGSGALDQTQASRIQHRVRARPLVDTNAELYRLLTREGFYGESSRQAHRRGRTHAATVADDLRQRERTTSDALSLSPTEVAILCDLFQSQRTQARAAAAATSDLPPQQQQPLARSTRIQCDLDAKTGLLALLNVSSQPVTSHLSAERTPAAAAAPTSKPKLKPKASEVSPATRVVVPPHASTSNDQRLQTKAQPAIALHADRLCRVLALVEAHNVGLDAAFALFDTDHDGFVSHTEFLHALRSMGTVFADVSDAEVLAIAAAIDTNNDRRVDPRELRAFLTAATAAASKLPLSTAPKTKTAAQWRDEVQRILVRAVEKGVSVHQLFATFDTSGDGRLARREFSSALQKLGVPAAMATDASLLEAFDTDGDGSISFIEFLTSLKIAADDVNVQQALVERSVDDMRTIVRETLQRVASQQQDSGVSLAQVFAHWDTDKSGTLSIDEFTHALQQLLHSATATTAVATANSNPLAALEASSIRAFVATVNTNSDDTIDYREFLAMCGVSSADTETEAQSYAASSRVRTEKKLIQLLVRALQSGIRIEQIFAQLDANADGSISIRELQQALNTFFPSATESVTTADAAAIAARFDADSDRNVSFQEFQSFSREIERHQQSLMAVLMPHVAALDELALQSPSLALGKWQQLCVRDFRLARSDVEALKPALAYFDVVDATKKVDMLQLCALLKVPPTQVPPTQVPQAASTAALAVATVASTDPLTRLKTLLDAALAAGLDAATLFREFDADNDGSVSHDEFMALLHKLEGFMDVSDAECAAMLAHIDGDRSGRISLTEFQALLAEAKDSSSRSKKSEGSSNVMKAPAAATATVAAAPNDAPSVADRLRSLLQLAAQSGADVSACFSHFDTDHDGAIAHSEFVQGMRSLAGFEAVSDDDVRALIAVLDSDSSGSVSLNEFRAFMRVDASDVDAASSSGGSNTDAAAADAPLAEAVEKTSPRAVDASEVAGDASMPPQATNTVEAAEDALVTIATDRTPPTAAHAKPNALAPKPAPVTRTSSFGAAKSKTKPPLSSAFAARRANTDKESVAAAAATASDVDDAAAGASADATAASPAADASRALPSATTTTTPAPRPNKAPLQRPPSLAAARAAKAAANRAAAAAATEPTPLRPTDAVVAALDQLRALLVAAQVQGIDPHASFAHFDADNNGRLTYDEFVNGVRQLGVPAFEQLQDADVVAMATALDATQSGEIVVQDLVQLMLAAPRGGADAALTTPRASSGAIANAATDSSVEVAAGDRTKRMPLSARGASATTAAQAPLRRTSSLRPALQRSVTTATAAEQGMTVSTGAFNVGDAQTPSVTRTTSFQAKRSKPPPHQQPSTIASAATTAPQPTSDAASLQNTSDANDTSVAAVPPQSFTSQSPAPPVVDLVTNCTYAFHSDPRIRAVELKLRRAAVAAYTRGIVPLRIVTKYLTHGDNDDSSRRTRVIGRTSKYQQQQQKCTELLRVEFLQVLMELGLSLLSDSASQNSSDGATNDELRGDGRPFVATKMHDHLYARQLERLARYQHHTHAATRAQRQLVRAAKPLSTSKAAKVTAEAEASLRRFADDKRQLLRVLSFYRDGQKKALVYGLLREQVTTTIALAPRFASLLFFELPFTNPYNHSERFQLEIVLRSSTNRAQHHSRDDATAATAPFDLALVTSNVEWTFYREHVPLAYCGDSDNENLPPVEPELLDDENEVVLDAHDRIHVPLRLRWLDPTTRQQQQSMPDALDITSPLAASVVVRSCTHGHTVALFKLALFPQPLICHRVLRFSHAGNSIWRCRLAYPPGKFVVCMDPRVAVDDQSSDRMAPPSDARAAAHGSTIGLKCRVGAYPSRETFYVVLYDDAFFARVFQVWHVVIQATLRLDVHATLGQRVTTELVIRGDAAATTATALAGRQTRHVQCFASCATPCDVQFHPPSVFALVPHAFNRIALSFCTTAWQQHWRHLQSATAAISNSPPQCCVHVHLVDVERHELVGAWSVFVTLTLPRITKTYELTLPLAKPALKKIAYANVWDEPQTITLRSSAPSQLEPRDAQLRLARNSSAFLRLGFAAVSTARRDDVVLFINDCATDETEACLLFCLTYA